MFWLRFGVRIRTRIIVQIVFVIEKFQFLPPVFICFIMLREPVQNVIWWGVLRALGIIVSFGLVLSFTVPIIWTLCLGIWSGFCAGGAVQSSSTHFLCFILGLHHVGDSCYLGKDPLFCLFCLTNIGFKVSFRGIGPDSLATKKLVEAGMIFGHWVSSSGCWPYCWHLGWFCHSGNCHRGRINGQGWVHKQRLCNHSYLEPSLYRCFGSLLLLCFLGTGVFHGEGFGQVNRCWCTVMVGYQSCLLVLGRFSFFLLGMGRDRALDSRNCRIWPGWYDLSWMSGCL